ncbi:MAG: hypothetical protein NXI10_00950 [bacterium]|nr:hypothetical protein [bacterium]
MEFNEIQYKKPAYRLKAHIKEHLRQYSRLETLPISYDDLLHFKEVVPNYDEDGNNTLWFSAIYDQFETENLYRSLIQIYEKLIHEGDPIPYLSIARVDFCSFGNSKPFRVMVRNEINDNYDYFYVKRADASRVYGLELEEIFSPDKVNYLVHEQTLIEEHVVGVPVDQFILENKDVLIDNRLRFAKEFVKFNERSFIRLLGDMRSYNYVVEITRDFDNVQYRLRAMDFDQQSYEGRLNLYKPQFYKDNYELVKLVQELMTHDVALQYQKMERVAMRRRFTAARKRTQSLLRHMIKDKLTTPENLKRLKKELADFHKDDRFLTVRSVGAVLNLHLERSLNIQILSKAAQ